MALGAGQESVASVHSVPCRFRLPQRVWRAAAAIRPHAIPADLLLEHDYDHDTGILGPNKRGEAYASLDTGREPRQRTGRDWYRRGSSRDCTPLKGQEE